MKNWFEKAGKFILSLITDSDWDGDATKVMGIILIIISVIGFFCAIADWAIMLGIGTTALVSGKFTKQG